MPALDKITAFAARVLGRARENKSADLAYSLHRETTNEKALKHIADGNALEDAGRLAEAGGQYENAIKLAPGLARAHLNYGNVLLAMDQPEEDISVYSTALHWQSDLAAAHFNIGNAHTLCNRLHDAIQSYDEALAIKPDFVDAWVAKGNVQGDLKNPDAAIECYQMALKLQPDYAEVLLNLGNTFRAMNRPKEAVNCFNQVLAHFPESPELHRSLGLAYKVLDRPVEAISSFQRAVELKKSYVDAHIDLANTYRELGSIDKAVETARLARDLDPDNSGAWSLLLFCLSDDDRIDKRELFAEHRNFGKHFEHLLVSSSGNHKNSKEPDRILRVGFVSGDLRNHAVASFFEPLLQLFLEMRSLSIYIYETSGLEDDTTRRIKSAVSFWKDVETLSNGRLFQLIQSDRIDILIDLSGHTPANRLLVFARKPAPVQMSWIGYPGTTGLKAVDYYVGDKHFLPSEEYDEFFSEKILRIPANAPFRPADRAPDVNDLPAVVNGHVTFGSFNRIDKIGRKVVTIWSSLLNSLPRSKLIIAGMPVGGSFSHLIDWFSEEGVDTSRLEFHRRSSMADYLKMHHRVDICLDTFPYGGGTTTCHALWMGVPTLTLVGPTPAAGVGRAILSHVDLQDSFCTYDPDDFVAKGKWLAGNLGYLNNVRLSLRKRMIASPLLQPGIVAEGMELAFRHAWHRWCADLPANSFEVSHASRGLAIIGDFTDTSHLAA